MLLSELVHFVVRQIFIQRFRFLSSALCSTPLVRRSTVEMAQDQKGTPLLITTVKTQSVAHDPLSSTQSQPERRRLPVLAAVSPAPVEMSGGGRPRPACPFGPRSHRRQAIFRPPPPPVTNTCPRMVPTPRGNPGKLIGNIHTSNYGDDRAVHGARRICGRAQTPMRNHHGFVASHADLLAAKASPRPAEPHTHTMGA
jgi:hypothetical protein